MALDNYNSRNQQFIASLLPKIAEYFGGDLLARVNPSMSKVLIRRGEQDIVLDIADHSENGDSCINMQTRFRSPYKNHTGFYCSIRKSSTSPSKDNFDADFSVKSNQPDQLKEILCSKILRSSLKQRVDMNLEVKTKNRFLGDFHPAGMDEIEYIQYGEIPDFSEIQAIVEIMEGFYTELMKLRAWPA